MDGENPENLDNIKELTKPQRRVLGVLLEKAYTTRDSYPLTLKALTTGCNQKSNRSPVTNYSEDAVLDTLESLREMGLTGELHTDGGRAPRYRHYMRKRFTFTEPQLAAVAELLLRGRQQMGELRARASRMVQIDGLKVLREELQPLLDAGFIQASGSLERRGIEVDHGFYKESEGQELGFAPAESAAPPAATPPAEARPSAPQTTTTTNAPAVAAAPSSSSEAEVKELREEVAMLTEEHEKLSNRVSELASELERIARQAGID